MKAMQELPLFHYKTSWCIASKLSLFHALSASSSRIWSGGQLYSLGAGDIWLSYLNLDESSNQDSRNRHEEKRRLNFLSTYWRTKRICLPLTHHFIVLRSYRLLTHCSGWLSHIIMREERSTQLFIIFSLYKIQRIGPRDDRTRLTHQQRKRSLKFSERFDEPRESAPLPIDPASNCTSHILFFWL